MARRKTQTTVLDYNSPLIPAVFADVEGKDVALAATYSRRETNEAPILSFPNIDGAISPFKASDIGMDTRDAVRLCIKASWVFPLLRNVVEVMGELSNSELLLRGSNKKTRDFVEAWLERVNMWQLKEQFFREWFRSANCFIYKMDGKIPPAEIKKMTQVFAAADDSSIPLKYVILEPTSITASGNLLFGNVTYSKVLSPYEIQQLKNPQTPEAKALLASLDSDTRKAIQDGLEVNLKLDPKKLNVLLYKAQPYEHMGVPMAYGVLKDIEAKLELKRIDLSIARTTDRALLLITVGETPNQWHKGGNNINPATLLAIQQAFANEGIARTLIADWTVKGEWLIPDINKILGPEKYIQLDKDINQGLNAVLFGEGEKFANTSIKVQVFIERLKEARNAFLHNFLQPEIKRVCKAIGAKNYPEVYFEDLSFKDELQYAKLAVQMAQLGLLTPEELFDNLDSGKLPLMDESLESQEKFAKQREAGLYQPIVGGSTEIQKQQLQLQGKQINNQFELGKESNQINHLKAIQPKATGPKAPAGRPKGATAPRTSSTPSPIGTSKASMEGFSLSKFRDLVPLISEVHNQFEKKVKKQYNTRKLNDAQGAIVKMMVESIITNEEQDKWLEKIDEYIAAPIKKEIDPEKEEEIKDLMIAHDIDSYTAAMVRLTKKTIQHAS